MLPERSLSFIGAFYSNLYEQGITQGEYERACRIWNRYKCETLADFTRIYVQSDVLMLADIFENFRKMGLEHYQLDPAHYYTAPGFSWDALLKATDIELELISDPEMHLFLEQGIRGGFSGIIHRYAEANNPHCPNHDQSKPTSFITYLDANNLYGYSMCQPMPVKDFQWVSACNFDLQTAFNDDGKGYSMEVDLE